MSKQSSNFSDISGERPLSGAVPSDDPQESEDPPEGEGKTRRDFFYVATGAMTTVGVGLAAWPVVDSMNPSADVLAVSTVEVDLSPVEVGQRILVSWRQRPIFINHRTVDEIALARADDTAALIDPERDRDRVQREEWLVVIGICTHLGCVPLGQRRGDRRGKFGGYFCACHGSLYDTAGRVRQGPAPRNLDLPPYTFVDATTLRIG